MTNPFEAMIAARQAEIDANGGQPAHNAGGELASMLGSITTGRTQAGVRIVIGGLEKMGKTTLACSAPRALLVPLEMGFASMNVPKTRVPSTFPEVMLLLSEIKQAAMAGRFEPRSLIFDTATALERLIDAQTIVDDPTSQQKRLTMETAHGGYGKAYAHSNMLFDRFTKACDELAFHGGINIILTCHVFAARAIDPQFGEFDTWDLLLHSPKNQKTHGKREMITQWADIVGFLHEPMFISKGEGETLAKATSLGRGRVLGVSRTPGYVAGNRYGLIGEIPIPDPNTTSGPQACGWNWIADAIYKQRGLDFFNRDAL